MDEITVPKNRIKIIKNSIQKVEYYTNTKIKIENENEIIIEGDAYNEYNAKNIIQAIARGFKLNDALKLLNENIYADYIQLKEFLNNEKQIKNIKGRVIGREGKAKEEIEAISGATIAVYGNTIGIIGAIESITIAKAGIEVLIKGGKHNTAYKVMEKRKRTLDRW